MKTLKLILGLILPLAIATPAFATTFSSSHRFFVYFNFSSQAFGKPVAGVYAHVGVLTKAAGYRGGQTTWQDVKHLRMDRTGDHFFAKAILHGSSSYEYQYAQGTVVQYWVYFADGSQMVTDTVQIPNTGKTFSNDSDLQRALFENQSQFDRTDDCNRTRADEITSVTMG